jgi:putative ABC transport system permease protein
MLWRAGLRQMARQPGQTVLAVAGVALGVAVLVAVDLATGSAQRAFELSAEAVAGRATHQIVGGPLGLPDTLFPRLVLDSGATAAPIVEDWVTLPPPRRGQPERVLRVLGVDPFSDGALRPYLAAGDEPAGAAAGGDRLALFASLLLRPGACLLSAATAAEAGLRPGDAFRVRTNGGWRPLVLAGVLRPTDSAARRAVADLLFMDIAAAQELLERDGRLDRIDLRLPPAASPAGRAQRQTILRLLARLAPGAQLLDAAGRIRAVSEMTRAFRINLAALSLLALACCAFLIYNTMTFSVVRRRPLLGTLRTLGVTRRQVLALILGEAAVVAAAGTAAGLAAGVPLGRALLHLVTRSINDLYFVVSVRDLAVAPGSLLRAAAVGLGATLGAALAPALEATLTPPSGVLSRSLLESRLRRALPRATLLGAALLGAGALLLAVPPPGGSPAGAAGAGLALAFAGLGAFIAGCALLAPAATVALMRLARPPLAAIFGLRGRMAAGGVEASLSRTAVAIAALMVAVSVTVGIGVMIDSFRHTFVRWLDGELEADIYVAATAGGGGRGAPFPPELAARAAALPGVSAVHAMRRIALPTAAGPLRLLAVDEDRRGYAGLDLREGDPRTVWEQVAGGEAALVSEPFSRRHEVHAGDRLRLPTAAGEHGFAVAGVYTDFASDAGVVMVSRRTYLRYWHDPLLSGMSLDLAAGATSEAAIDATIARLHQTLGATRPFVITSNRSLKQGSLQIFDRTFVITGVLRLLAGLVAAIGVLSALTALQLERAREIGVLRAAGLTPGQVWQMVTLQTGLMGLAAGLLALPVGLALAVIMIYVINRRSFGWTLQMQISPGVLAQALLLALVAALAAGLYPAWRMARTRPALALREE